MFYHSRHVSFFATPISNAQESLYKCPWVPLAQSLSTGSVPNSQLCNQPIQFGNLSAFWSVQREVSMPSHSDLRCQALIQGELRRRLKHRNCHDCTHVVDDDSTKCTHIKNFPNFVKFWSPFLPTFIRKTDLGSKVGRKNTPHNGPFRQILGGLPEVLLNFTRV